MILPNDSNEGTGAVVPAASCSVSFPTSAEAKKILEEGGIDTTEMKARCMAMICEKTGHRWELTWPLDPCEYTCTRCGVKTLH